MVVGRRGSRWEVWRLRGVRWQVAAIDGLVRSDEVEQIGGKA